MKVQIYNKKLLKYEPLATFHDIRVILDNGVHVDIVDVNNVVRISVDGIMLIQPIANNVIEVHQR